jgi:transposase
MGEIKRFDKAFKEQVVLKVLSKEKSVPDMSKELGVYGSTIRDWIKNYKLDGISAFPGSGNLKPEDVELRRLRKELADLKEETEILKKAAAYFAKNQKRNSSGLYKNTASSFGLRRCARP